MSDTGIGINEDAAPLDFPFDDVPPEWAEPGAGDTGAPPAPATLSNMGRDSVRRLLEVEGAIVHSLRCPDGPPDAWRWTSEEIDQLMPALTAVADRYGASRIINEHGPFIVAGAAVTAHVTRSLAAERAWKQDATPAFDQEPHEPPPTHEPAPAAAATPVTSTGIAAAGPGDEPPPGLGREQVDRLARALSPPGGPLGPRE